MASNQTQDFAKKNEQKSIFQEDKDINEKIYLHSHIKPYQSKNRKNQKYNKGIPAVFAFLMEYRNLKNQDFVEKLGEKVELSTFRTWKSGKVNPSKEMAIKFCIIFKLNHSNSLEFIKLFKHYIVPEKHYNAEKIIYNEDFYIDEFLKDYRFLDDDQMAKMKEEYPLELGYLFF